MSKFRFSLERGSVPFLGLSEPVIPNWLCLAKYLASLPSSQDFAILNSVCLELALLGARWSDQSINFYSSILGFPAPIELLQPSALCSYSVKFDIK